MRIENEFIYDLKITDLNLDIVERERIAFSNPLSAGDIINEYGCIYLVTVIEHFTNNDPSVVSCKVLKPGV